MNETLNVEPLVKLVAIIAAQEIVAESPRLDTAIMDTDTNNADAPSDSGDTNNADAPSDSGG